jgi:hypothetical protein
MGFCTSCNLAQSVVVRGTGNDIQSNYDLYDNFPLWFILRRCQYIYHRGQCAARDPDPAHENFYQACSSIVKL